MKASRPKFLSSSSVTLVVAAFAFIVSGCLDADRRLEHSIKEAVTEAQLGNTSAAINRLESYQDAHPNHPGVAEALGIAYEAHGNFLLASNYYQKAARLAPEKRHLLKASAMGQVQAGRMEDAAKRLEAYLESFPEDGATWLELGRIRYGIAPDEHAADALTRGILLTDASAQQASDFQVLGNLYLQQKDFASADYYLNQALALSEQDSGVQGKVLVDLIRSSVEQSDWDVADLFLKRIASTAPELLQTSEVMRLQETILEILALRDSDDTKALELTAPVSPDATEVAEPVELEDASDGTSESVIADEPVERVEQPDKIEETEVADKDVVNDPVDPTMDDGTARSDALADATGPALESEPSTDPELAALDPVLPQPVDADSMEKEQASNDVELLEPSDVEASEGKELDGSSDSNLEQLEAYEAPENEPELLLIQAQQAIADGNIAAAIRMSWDSIHRRPENPSGWFILSRAYVALGQNLNAESAALEAMRVNPNNKKIVLNYLGILQRSRGAQRFHEELLKAYQRFPSEPDFVLALARSYARIQNDPENAAALYRRFFDLAPADAANLQQIRDEAVLVD